MKMNTTASTKGTESATMIPVRAPSEAKLTSRTIINASMKERVNSLTASSTTLG